MIIFKILFFIFFIFQNYYLKTKNDINLFSESGERLKKILHINEYISKYFSKNDPINLIYSNLLMKYFGLDILNGDKRDFDLRLINGIEQIEFKLSESEKYILDNLLNFIIEKSRSVLNKINNDKFLKIIQLAFLTSSIFPSKDSFFIYEYKKNYEVSNNIEDFIDEISSSLNLLFSEIGIKNDFYLYKDFENNFNKILNNKNYKFYNIVTYFSDENIYKNKNKTISLFLSLISNFNKNKNLQDISNLKNNFKIYTHDSDFINESIKYFLKKDTIFNLFILGRIGTEKNISIFKINNNVKSILFNYSSLARFILDNLFIILGEKKINWNNLKPISFSNERLNDLLMKISFFGSMDMVYGELFYKAYSDKILSLIY